MLQLAFSVYSQPFKRPLYTAHGRWQTREGIIVTLTDATGRQGQGEIAPLPWFGTETLADAIAYCKRLGEQLSSATIEQIPDSYPACQFGFTTALMALQSPFAAIALQPHQVAHLIALGQQSVSQLQDLESRGATTFKCKIGVGELGTELAAWQHLSQHAKATRTFRLDANGSLDLPAAHQWLELAQTQGNVEFIEQPLAPGQVEAMQRLGEQYDVAIALDESVATFQDLTRCQAAGWSGVYVLKIAIAGFPQRLQQFCQEHSLDFVCSSVFETAIGRQAALNVAQKLGSSRALGFGVQSWF